MFRKTAITIECIILSIGVLLSYSGTEEAVQYSAAYKPYYLYALLGVVFIVLLVVLRDKNFTVGLGILMIMAYVVFAGFHGYWTCALYADRMEALQGYIGKTVVLRIDGDTYVWNGKAFYDEEALEYVPLEGREVSVEVDGEKKTPHKVLVRQNDYSVLYYEMYTDAMGDYLVMVKTEE